ncbi:hypothetical protein RIdsm_05021 [Roseovarius indicus]|uniref:DUF4276 domain-containing protein n=1 Tax=Roseovarius indicus TaxID=540747 RepID=A0A5P3AIJ9_9RHOB|nr:hypothetical protein RIdsm_05021 [Roseovarius indicus]SFD78442.1 protein of unknown function [Roseovarius indicus]
MYLCSEDELGRAILKRLLADILGEYEPLEIGARQGGIGHIAKRLSEFHQLARYEYVFVLVDLDRCNCEVELRQDMFSSARISEPINECFVFSIAKREAESWLLADVDGLASYLRIDPRLINRNAEDSVLDPKEYLLQISQRSRNRPVKQALLPESGSKSKVGLGYNRVLTNFVKEHWNHEAAAERNATLSRIRRKLVGIVE